MQVTDLAPMVDDTAQFKIPFLVGVAGHRDLVPIEVPAIRAALRCVP